MSMAASFVAPIGMMNIVREIDAFGDSSDEVLLIFQGCDILGCLEQSCLRLFACTAVKQLTGAFTKSNSCFVASSTRSPIVRPGLTHSTNCHPGLPVSF